jgi:virginiamycin A acetyltransferase
LRKDAIIEYLRNSNRVKQARSLRSKKNGALNDLIFLVRLLFQKSPSQFMNRNPAYKKYDIGDYSYGFPEVLDSGVGTKLKIGKFCSVSPGVKILLSAEHQVSSVTTYPFDVFWSGAKGPVSKGDVLIGNDVWIGYGSIILSGVKIADGAVVGAGSVVASDIPAYGIAVGNPARIIKYRFEPFHIEYLLRLRWWDWPFDKILEWRSSLMDLDGQRRLSEYISSVELQNNPRGQESVCP